MTGCLWYLPVAIFLVVVLQGLELKAGIGFTIAISNKKPVVSRIWRESNCLASALQATVGVDGEHQGSRCLELLHRVRAHSGGHRGGATAPAHSRKPAVAAMPLHPLAERRPCPFLPAMKPKGRQFSVSTEAMGCCCGALVAPSGCVPGDGKENPARPLKTRLRFCFSARGPSCKNPGTCLYLFISFGSFGNMCCTLSK